jgi:hypothetical protein
MDQIQACSQSLPLIIVTAINVANFGREAMEAKCLLAHRVGNLFSIAVPDDGFLLDG